MDALQAFVFASSYIPHGHCYLWQQSLVSLHVMSDALIAIAYFSIPVMLVYFVRKRADVPFRGVFFLFGLFIVSCGTSHLASIWTLWYPAYWIEGVIKAITALVSLYTALTLFPVLPQALALPSPEKLQQINQELSQQIEERKQAEVALQNQLDFDRLISSISTRFINLNFASIDAGIEQALQEIAQFHQVDTSYVMTLEGKGDSFSMTHEWVSASHLAKLERVQAVPLAQFPWASQQLLAGDILYVPALEQLPPEAAVDQQNWGQFGLQSLVGVPLLFQEKVLGWVGFASFREEKHWSESSIQLLKIFGEILTNALQRQAAERQLRQLNQELEGRVEERTAALQKSEQRFRSLFESAPDFIHVLDTQGVIQQVNPMVVERSGFSERELAGQPLMRFLSPETQKTCMEEFKQLLERGYHHQEMEFVCKDGRVRTMDCACTVVADEASQDPYVLVLQRDVSERKKAEARLQEAERRWRSLLENVRLVVVGLDPLGRVNYINPYGLEVMGYERLELEGQNWFERCVPRTQAGQTAQVFERMLQGQIDVHLYSSNSVLTQGGNERLIAWNTTLLKDAQGSPIGTMSIGEDITERYSLQLMKDEFISVVSHELRTPLTSIHGALDLLSSGVITPGSERGEHVLGIAADNASRLVRLVNDILELERLESGKIQLEIEVVQTTDVTGRAEQLMQVLAEQSGVVLEIQDPGLDIEADGDRLIQVLTNLVDNAIKFSAPQDRVTVTVERVIDSEQTSGQAPCLLFQVQDQGRGIPATQLDQIFERFQQVDASDSRSKGGTGLGLAICRSIVQQHGGQIWVESQEGAGSCFLFTIPTHRLI